MDPQFVLLALFCPFSSAVNLLRNVIQVQVGRMGAAIPACSVRAGDERMLGAYMAKEIQRGDVHNLVLLVQHEQRCTVQQAIVTIAAQYDDEVGGFLALERTLPD